MIRFSAILVAAAIAVLVPGVLATSLVLVYLSIGVSVLAAVLLAAGTKGKRFSLPNSRILIHQPAIESGYGQSSDLEIQAREIQRMRQAMEAVLAKHTGRDEEQIRRDIERDKFLTANEAKEYGLVDDVLTMLKRQADVVSS